MTNSTPLMALRTIRRGTPDGYRLLKSVDSREEVETFRRAQEVSIHEATRDGSREYYRCEKCKFRLMVDIPLDGDERFTIFGKGEHDDHSSPTQPRRRAPDWSGDYFFICELTSAEDIAATKRGHVLQSSNSRNGYYKCSHDGCTFGLRLSWPDASTRDRARLHVKGDHNHAL